MKITEKRWMHIETGVICPKDAQVPEDLRDKYRIVTVTWDEPEWEEVEVVRYTNVYKEVQSSYLTKEVADKYAQDDRIACVKLTGTYRRRKPEPEPEVWEGTTKRSVSGNVAIIHLSSEWIHKRVRVEVIEP